MKFIDSEIDPTALIAVSPVDVQQIKVPMNGTPGAVIARPDGRPAPPTMKVVTHYCLTIVLGSTTMGCISIMESSEDKGVVEAARMRLVGVIKEREKKEASE